MAAQSTAAPASALRSGDIEQATTVTVACKLPNGLILVLHAMDDVQEPIMGGGWKTVKRARPVGARCVVHGSAVRVDRAPAHSIIGGYGLTPNIDGEFFAEWLRQNADHDAVRNNLVFALAKPDATTARAREQAAVLSGLEPVNQSKLPRGIATATTNPI